jgi:hypothetical protein
LQPGDKAGWLAARQLIARPWPSRTPLHRTWKSVVQNRRTSAASCNGPSFGPGAVAGGVAAGAGVAAAGPRQWPASARRRFDLRGLGRLRLRRRRHCGRGSGFDAAGAVAAGAVVTGAGCALGVAAVPGDGEAGLVRGVAAGVASPAA